MERLLTRHMPPVSLRLDDETAERVRRSHAEAITALQAAPAVSAVVLADVALVDAVATPIPHGLGRVPRRVLVSPSRGATSTGRIVETRDGIDREKYLVLTATGHGATIKVDIEVA